MAKSPRKIDDVGVKIGRAAKDTRGLRLTQEAIDAMTPIEKAKRITKANLWPEPDYLKLVENGMDGAAAVMLKIIYDNIASKPALRWARSSPESQMAVIDAYSDILLMIRDKAEASTTPDQIMALASQMSLLITGGERKSRLNLDETERQRSIYRAKNSNPLLIGHYDRSMALVFGRSLLPDVPDAQKGMIIRESSKKPGHFFIQDLFGHRDHMLVMALDRASGRALTGADILSPLVTSGERIGTHRYFKSREEAQAAIEERYNALQAGLTSSASKKARRKAEGPITRARLEKLTRTGPSTRKGDVSATDLMTEFGFRGIEFGEWVPDKERRMVVNMAWDAFSDLAEVLQVEHKEIGLGGLALGFGSRGKSSASAHYEPDLHVFNLTRMNGAGSMAHEYGHALDHYVFERAHGLKVIDRRAVMATSLPKDMPLPPAEQAVWSKMVSAMFRKPRSVASHNNLVMLSHAQMVSQEDRERMKVDPDFRLPTPSSWSEWNKTVRTDYAAESAKSSKSDYYLSHREMYARAFESWVFDRLKSMGRQSDYLVNSVEESYAEASEMRFNPYPAGEEREVIGGFIEDTVVSALAQQRIVALESGVIADRERRQHEWLNRAEPAISPEPQARTPETVAPATPSPAEPPQSSPAPADNESDYRIDKTKPISVEAWHASSLDAVLSVLVKHGYSNPQSSLSEADKAAVAGYVTLSMPEVVPVAQASDDMREKATDTLSAMMLLDRLGVSDALRSEAMEAIKTSGAGTVAADWIDPDHAEGVFQYKDTMARTKPASPAPPKPEEPSVSAAKPVQQAFNF